MTLTTGEGEPCFLPQYPNFLCWNYFHSLQKGYEEVMWSPNYTTVWLHHMSRILLSYTTCEKSAALDVQLQLRSVSLQSFFGKGLKILWSKIKQGIRWQRQISKTKGQSDKVREVIPTTCGADTTISAECTAESILSLFLFFFLFVFDYHEEQRAPRHPLPPRDATLLL